MSDPSKCNKGHPDFEYSDKPSGRQYITFVIQRETSPLVCLVALKRCSPSWCFLEPTYYVIWEDRTQWRPKRDRTLLGISVNSDAYGILGL